jgi:hypothetical protein
MPIQEIVGILFVLNRWHCTDFQVLQSVQGNGATGNNNHMRRGRGRGSGSGRGIGVSNFDLYPGSEEFSSVPQGCGYGAILSCQIMH